MTFGRRLVSIEIHSSWQDSLFQPIVCVCVCVCMWHLVGAGGFPGGRVRSRNLTLAERYIDLLFLTFQRKSHPLINMRSREKCYFRCTIQLRFEWQCILQIGWSLTVRWQSRAAGYRPRWRPTTEMPVRVRVKSRRDGWRKGNVCRQHQNVLFSVNQETVFAVLLGWLAVNIPAVARLAYVNKTMLLDWK